MSLIMHAVQKVGAQILEDFGKIDILVNNAGVTRDGLVNADVGWKIGTAVINTNLRGAFSFTQSIRTCDDQTARAAGSLTSAR